MQRRVVSILMILMIALQSIAGAMADVTPLNSSADIEHHCEGHDDAGPDCSCCSDHGAANLGCTAMCSVATAAPAIALAFPYVPAQRVPQLDLHWIAGPSYSPLNPPPIS